MALVNTRISKGMLREVKAAYNRALREEGKEVARKSAKRAAKRKAFGDAPPASEQDVVALTLPEPPSANRWWRRAGTHMHLSTAAQDYKALVAQQPVHVRFVDGPLAVSVKWYRGRKAGDLDKRLGILLDALQGVVYTTDAQITSLVARRFEDKANPRIEVVVCYDGGEE